MSDQCEDDDIVNALTAVVREADQAFQQVGGSSRHWVRDCFLSVLNRHGYEIRKRQLVACSVCGGSGSLQDMSCCSACGGGGKTTSKHELLAALMGVVRVADRNTPEFATARAAIAKASGVPEKYPVRESA